MLRSQTAFQLLSYQILIVFRSASSLLHGQVISRLLKFFHDDPNDNSEGLLRMAHQNACDFICLGLNKFRFHHATQRVLTMIAIILQHNVKPSETSRSPKSRRLLLGDAVDVATAQKNFMRAGADHLMIRKLRAQDVHRFAVMRRIELRH